MISHTLIHVDAHNLEINKKEVMRYLKMYSENFEVDNLIDECINIVYGVANLKGTYVKTAISVSENTVDFGFEKIKSSNLAKNLSNCTEAYVFIATLGIEVDRIIEKYFKLEPSKAIVCDCVATTLIESFCNYINNQLKMQNILRPRYSVGYGDCSIRYQKAILEMLDASRKVGVFLTDNFMMAPRKSVSAIIGIERTNLGEQK